MYLRINEKVEIEEWPAIEFVGEAREALAGSDAEVLKVDLRNDPR